MLKTIEEAKNEIHLVLLLLGNMIFIKYRKYVRIIFELVTYRGHMEFKGLLLCNLVFIIGFIS